MVENRIYPITPGDIIITRPYEYHHCILHSDEIHRHYCVFFDAPSAEGFLSRFFERRAGEKNRLTLSSSEKAEFISILEKLRSENVGECERYALIFRLLSIVESAQDAQEGKPHYSAELNTVLDYIEKRFTEDVSVKQLAAAAGMSVNTLERHFAKTLGMSPLSYLKKKRLAYSARLLAEGSSVIDACNASGFSDYSHFIILFKTAYGITPLKYKKTFLST
jgi:AraC-like DNA-binding protein